MEELKSSTYLGKKGTFLSRKELRPSPKILPDRGWTHDTETAAFEHTSDVWVNNQSS